MIFKSKSEGDWIQTISGRKFYPLNPKSEDVHIQDIAYALSMRPRYNGHVKEFLHYSIAEHSVLLSQNVLRYYREQTGFDYNQKYQSMIRLWCLLHDASEAYLPDIPSPVKKCKSMNSFKKIEVNIMKVIAEHYNLEPIKQPPIVCAVDRAILVSEKEQCMNKQIEWPGLYNAGCLNVKIQFLQPKEAYNLFVNTYLELIKKIEEEKNNEL